MLDSVGQVAKPKPEVAWRNSARAGTEKGIGMAGRTGKTQQAHLWVWENAPFAGHSGGFGLGSDSDPAGPRRRHKG
jgi:hypothetical protein